MGKPGRTDWQVGPVLKAKLNSQGTLFRGGTKHSSDKRYPRGYTPERQQEVAEAVVRPSITVDTRLQRTQSDDRVFHRGTQSAHFKDRKVRTSTDPDAPLTHESAQPIRDLVDNIARSTVPTQHLGGVQWRTRADQTLNDGSSPAFNVLGHYDVRGDALSKGQPVIRLREGQESNDSPIHEIGHHVSLNEATPHSEYRTGQQRGQEEAFADRYAYTHFRDRRGLSMPEMRVYPTPPNLEADQKRHFADSYHRGRGDIPAPNPFTKYGPGPRNAEQARFMEGNEAESRGETLFKTWDNGDGTMSFHESHPNGYGGELGWSMFRRPKA